MAPRAACWCGERMTAPILARSKLPPAAAVRGVTILGATGSIGASTVDLIKREPERYRVEAVSARRNAAALAAIAREVSARFAVVADPAAYGDLKNALAGSGIEVAAGGQAVLEAAQRPADWVMAAISGSIGLKPTLAAIERGATVALANKECLVCAGDLFMRRAASAGATVLPVPVDQDGLDPSRLPTGRPRLRLAYVTPSHQFPTGAIMPAARRQGLLAWARRYRVHIVEDDYDGDLRFGGAPIKALAAHDDHPVIYCGTFAKALFPSLRLGYLSLPAPLLAAGVDFVLEGLYALKKIGRSDERGYHAAETPVRRPAPREAAFTAETPLPAGGKKKYYN